VITASCGAMCLLAIKMSYSRPKHHLGWLRLEPVCLSSSDSNNHLSASAFVLPYLQGHVCRLHGLSAVSRPAAGCLQRCGRLCRRLRLRPAASLLRLAWSCFLLPAADFVKTAPGRRPDRLWV